MDLLQEVGDERFSTVLETLREDWPKHFLPYQTFQILHELKTAGCQFSFTLYLYGDAATGVYLSKISPSTQPGSMHVLYLYAPSNNMEAVSKVLQNSSRIPWLKEPFLFELVPSTLRPLVEKAFSSKEINVLTKPNRVFVFPNKTDLVLPMIPDDVYVDFLKEAHSQEVNDNWPFKYPGSYVIHRECITRIFGIGVFRKGDGKILSSAISNYTGGIFVLYTDPECRGKGYASIVILNMVQEIRKRGREPFCTINIENATSTKVFRKIGFKEVGMVDFYRIIE